MNKENIKVGSLYVYSWLPSKNTIIECVSYNEENMSQDVFMGKVIKTDTPSVKVLINKTIRVPIRDVYPLIDRNLIIKDNDDKPVSWRVVDFNSKKLLHRFHIVDQNNDSVLNKLNPEHKDVEESRNLAKMIASIPEMVRMLEKIADIYEQNRIYGLTSQDYIDIMNMINKEK